MRGATAKLRRHVEALRHGEIAPDRVGRAAERQKLAAAQRVALPGRQRDAVGRDREMRRRSPRCGRTPRRPPRCRRHARTPGRRCPADCRPAHWPRPARPGPWRPRSTTPNRRQPRRPASWIVTYGPGAMACSAALMPALPHAAAAAHRGRRPARRSNSAAIDAAEAQAVAGAEQERVLAGRIEQAQRGLAEDVPGAGHRHRDDVGLDAADHHGAGRHLRARRVAGARYAARPAADPGRAGRARSRPCRPGIPPRCAARSPAPRSVTRRCATSGRSRP